MTVILVKKSTVHADSGVGTVFMYSITLYLNIYFFIQ